MGIPLYVMLLFPCCFNIFFFNFCQIDYCVSQHVLPCIYPTWDSLCFLDLGDYFLSIVREVFSSYLFRYLALSQKSLRLSSFLFSLYPLSCHSDSHHPVFQLTYCSSASVVLLLIPSSLFFISVIVLFISLFFSSSRSFGLLYTC